MRMIDFITIDLRPALNYILILEKRSSSHIFHTSQARLEGLDENLVYLSIYYLLVY